MTRPAPYPYGSTFGAAVPPPPGGAHGGALFVGETLARLEDTAMKKLVLAKETVMRLQTPQKRNEAHPTGGTHPTWTATTIKSGCC